MKNEPMEAAILLRRLFRRALEAKDPDLLKKALSELKSHLQVQPEPAPTLVTLAKLLFEKAVSAKDLPLLDSLLALELRPEWLAPACCKAGKERWIEGYNQLRRHTGRPLGITLTEAFILRENNRELRPDGIPVKNLKAEIENLIAYARKTPGAMSPVCDFLKQLGYTEQSQEARQN